MLHFLPFHHRPTLDASTDLVLHRLAAIFRAQGSYHAPSGNGLPPGQEENDDKEAQGEEHDPPETFGLAGQQQFPVRLFRELHEVSLIGHIIRVMHG